ncbi:nonsense-mediated mRNA decay factor SMG8 isoform X1 [Microplitis mediator]|uniref:nonsense-mediated mRNA decay factor SMG8 isoform X1 n=1 Tax=Microplitis mediator TaxID=375433 RepID=UPI0025523034|nr:nonsense-mediated mRNA decay factor SMG8 isoform X1 [Microplitis mediator]
MRPKKFSIPWNQEESPAAGKVIIVSIIGKSQYRAKGCKSEMIGTNLLVDLLDHPTVNDDTMSEIEGYHDEKERVIYLHLRGLLDSQTLVSQYDSFIEKSGCKDFLSAWALMREKYAKALLVLFHISHIVIVSHPTHTFDYSYLHLFRALDKIRQKVSTQLSSLLGTISGLPKSWVTNCRPCPPRVLFYFETGPVELKQTPENLPNIKQLEHSMEDQIYDILKENHVVHNISSYCLFAIPANQEFVYIHTGSTESRDMYGYMMRKLIDSCKISSGSKNNTNNNNVNNNNNNKSDKGEGIFNFGINNELRSFKTFLHQHVNLAFSKGFDDNSKVGRHPVPSYFEIPSVSLFTKVANVVYEFFMHSTDKELSALHGLLNTDVKFSKSRCSKILPRALQTYQDNLPQHYGRAYHESKLAHAMAVFEMHARGPLYDEFSEKLQMECDKHWRTGKQMCEVLSLTGNPCTNPLHKGGSEGAGGGELVDKREDENELPIMEHCSGVRYVCACNCGQCQGPREDPFNLRHANFDWFQLMAKQCGCSQLEKIEFPVFQPSTHNFRPAQLIPGVPRKDSCSRVDISTSQNQTLACGSTDSPLRDNIEGYESGGQSQLGSDSEGEETRELDSKINLTPSEAHKVVIQVTDTDSENTKEKSLVRQPSTTEYLPGMLHTESPAGLLPQFSSWSLVCLGPSSLYSHNLGLQHQTGILATSAFLLPWDVTVRLEHQKEKGSFWPMVGDNHSSYNYNSRGKNYQNSNALKCRKSKGGKEFVVKIFVGVEYECPRGHRFMASAPDKVLKATGSGIVKDSGNKVTSNTADMPLYFPCPCRQPKPLIAQLMRIHVVTPKAPVHVTLNPRVQPGPPPCPIFVTGAEEPIKLSQSAYWVLRLPYVYMGEKGPYLVPKEPVSISHGRLLAGMYGISEVVPEKKLNV